MRIGNLTNGNDRKVFLASIVSAAAIIGIQATAFSAPSATNWGVHVFGYLPVSHLLLSIVVLGTVIVLAWRFDPSPVFGKMAAWSDGRTWTALLLLAAALALLTMFRHPALPLLGDGYTVLNNFRNTFAGVHSLSTSREPLGMGFFYLMALVLQTFGAGGPWESIIAGDIVLIAAFAACTTFTVKEFYPEPADGRRIAALFFALSVPFMQLLFGYAEVYGVTLAALSLTVLGIVRYHRGRLPFLFIPSIFAFQAGVHYLGALLLPLLIVLTVREWRSSGWRPVASGFGIALPLLGAFLLWLGPEGILPKSPHSHILPISSIQDTYTAYTLFSGEHLRDLANLFFLLGGASFAAIAVARHPVAGSSDRAVLRYLLLAAAPAMIFALFAKFDLGAAKDWDVTAPWFYPLAILGAFRLLGPGPGRIRPLVVFGTASLLTTAAFVNLNADRDASLRRVKDLMDPAFMSHGGTYQTTIHLSTAYLETREIDSMVVLWKNFIGRYPDDLRGYQKLAKSMWEYGEASYDGIMDVYDVWLEKSGGDPAVERQYAGFCVLAGVSSMKHGRAIEGRRRFARAMRADSSHAAPWYHTGSSFLREGNPDSALPYLRRAVAIKPGDLNTLEALAGACLMKGDSVGALSAYRAAAGVGSRRAQEYLLRLPSKD